jgi:hypothetical protein
MKTNKIITAKQLKEIAASIREIALTLETRKDTQCLQLANLKTKKVKGRVDLDIYIKFKFSLVEVGDIKEVGEILECL